MRSISPETFPIPIVIAISVTIESGIPDAGCRRILVLSPISGFQFPVPRFPGYHMPISRLTISPSCKILSLAGIACTTSSLIEAHRVAGYGALTPETRYPLNEGVPPDSTISFSASRSSSNVEMPGAAAAATRSKTSASRRPPSRRILISSFVFMVMAICLQAVRRAYDQSVSKPYQAIRFHPRKSDVRVLRSSQSQA